MIGKIFGGYQGQDVETPCNPADTLQPQQIINLENVILSCESQHINNVSREGGKNVRILKVQRDPLV